MDGNVKVRLFWWQRGSCEVVFVRPQTKVQVFCGEQKNWKFLFFFGWEIHLWFNVPFYEDFPFSSEEVIIPLVLRVFTTDDVGGKKVKIQIYLRGEKKNEISFFAWTPNSSCNFLETVPTFICVLLFFCELHLSCVEAVQGVCTIWSMMGDESCVLYKRFEKERICCEESILWKNNMDASGAGVDICEGGIGFPASSCRSGETYWFGFEKKCHYQQARNGCFCRDYSTQKRSGTLVKNNTVWERWQPSLMRQTFLKGETRHFRKVVRGLEKLL